MSLTITQAALHAALRRARDDGTHGSLDTLLTLLDPAHAAPANGDLFRVAAQMVPPSPLACAPSFHAPTLAAEEAQPAHNHYPPAGPEEAARAASETPADTRADTARSDGATDQAVAPHPAFTIIRRAPSGGGAPVTKWTPERLALLRAEWATCTDRPALFARINALPGDPLASPDAVRVKAGDIGLRSAPGIGRAIQRAAGARGGKASVATHPTLRPSEIRTEERFAAFKALWLDPMLSAADIQRRINALPGKPMSSSTTLYTWAKQAGLSTHRAQPEDEEAEAPGAPAAPASAPPTRIGAHGGSIAMATPHAPRKVIDLEASQAEAKADAFECFASGMSVRAVADDFGLPLTQVSTWQSQWKAQQHEA